MMMDMRYYITGDGVCGGAEDVPFFETDSAPEDFAEWGGCWIGGHWGQYAVAQMVEIAREYGYDDARITDIAARHLASMGRSDESGITESEREMLSFAADTVEDWLNDHVAPEGYVFGWEDCEFFLIRVDHHG